MLLLTKFFMLLHVLFGWVCFPSGCCYSCVMIDLESFGTRAFVISIHWWLSFVETLTSCYFGQVTMKFELFKHLIAFGTFFNDHYFKQFDLIFFRGVFFL